MFKIIKLNTNKHNLLGKISLQYLNLLNQFNMQ